MSQHELSGVRVGRTSIPQLHHDQRVCRQNPKNSKWLRAPRWQPSVAKPANPALKARPNRWRSRCPKSNSKILHKLNGRNSRLRKPEFIPREGLSPGLNGAKIRGQVDAGSLGASMAKLGLSRGFPLGREGCSYSILALSFKNAKISAACSLVGSPLPSVQP
jgi:hypothetical protein